MRSGENNPVNRGTRMNAALIISATYPRHKVKTLARELGCSERQARRMIETGNVPEAFQDRLLSAVEMTLDRLTEYLGAVRNAQRKRQYRRLVAEGRGDDPGLSNTDSILAARQTARSEKALSLTLPENGEGR